MNWRKRNDRPQQLEKLPVARAQWPDWRSDRCLYRSLTMLPCDLRADYCWAATNSR
jgi:hypothetical protein